MFPSKLLAAEFCRKHKIMAIDKKGMLTHAVTFKNYSNYFGGVWGLVCLFFQKKKKLEFFRNSQFHLSLRATAAAIKSHCYLHGFDGFAAKFTQQF